MKKVRGMLLTAVLVFAVFASVTSFSYLFNWTFFELSYTKIPPWLWPYQFVLLASSITEALGVWFWKKWAVILSIITTIIYPIVELLFIRPLQSQPEDLTSFITIFLLFTLIWFYAIYRKWGNFN